MSLQFPETCFQTPFVIITFRVRAIAVFSQTETEKQNLTDWHVSRSLIAIMLGRLEMTVEECIDAYKKMMRQVFEKKDNRSVLKKLSGVTPRFSSKELENAIRQVLELRGVSADEKFEVKGSKCKV